MTQLGIDNYKCKRVAIVLVLLLAFGLRIYDLGVRSLWFDEGMEYWVATSSVREMLQNVRDGIQDPPFYSFLLHLWMKLGRGEFYLRFLSVIFSFMSVVGTMLIGRKISGLSTALIAGLIMTILPSQIRYAQEAGQYALMGCLLVWSLLVLQELLKGNNWYRYFLWVMLAIAATYSYYGAVITVLVPYLVVLAKGVISKNWEHFQKRLLILLVYIIGIIPLIFYFLPRQLFRGPTTEAFTISPSSLVEELRIFWRSTQQLVAFQFTGWPWTHIPLWLSLLLVTLLLLFSIRARETKVSRLSLWLLSSWIVYYIISKLGLFPYGFRYGLVLTPMLIPIVSHGLSGMFKIKCQRIVGVLFLISIIIICTVSFPYSTLRVRLYPEADWIWPEKEDLRSVVKYWLENRSETEPTWVYYGAVPVFAYYLHLFGQDRSDLAPTWYIHCWWGDPSKHCRTENVYYGKWTRHLTRSEKILAIQSVLPPNPETIWLVFSHIYHNEDVDILSGLLEDYRLVRKFEQTNASVYLLEAR